MKRHFALLLASLGVLLGISAVGCAEEPASEFYIVSPDGTLLSVRGPKVVPDAPISFQISKAGWAESRVTYPIGHVSIRCVFRNNGSQPAALLLKEHDEYLGRLAYPENIQARIENSAHKVLTVNELSKEGWWTWFYVSNQTYHEEVGDRITIPRGEQVTRVLKLDDVLWACPGLPRGLPAGHFIVQLRVDTLESNRLEIDVAPE